jgi:hypothetical protein
MITALRRGRRVQVPASATWSELASLAEERARRLDDDWLPSGGSGPDSVVFTYMGDEETGPPRGTQIYLPVSDRRLGGVRAWFPEHPRPVIVPFTPLDGAALNAGLAEGVRWAEAMASHYVAGAPMEAYPDRGATLREHVGDEWVVALRQEGATPATPQPQWRPPLPGPLVGRPGLTDRYPGPGLRPS